MLADLSAGGHQSHPWPDKARQEAIDSRYEREQKLRLRQLSGTTTTTM
jgi:hypothetical protein